jgi:hypothetical protein
MRRKLTLSLVAELALLCMLGMTAIAENDQTLGTGAPRAKLLGSLNVSGVSTLQNVDVDSAILTPLAGKTAVYLRTRDDVAVLDKNRTARRTESQVSDAGIDPFITGDPGMPARRWTIRFEAS